MVKIGFEFRYLDQKCTVTGFGNNIVKFVTASGMQSQIEMGYFEREILGLARPYPI